MTDQEIRKEAKAAREMLKASLGHLRATSREAHKAFGTMDKFSDHAIKINDQVAGVLSGPKEELSQALECLDHAISEVLDLALLFGLVK